MNGQFKIIRAANISGVNIILYKHPTSRSVRGYHQIISVDQDNNEIGHLTFRHIRRQQDANRFFNYIISLSNKSLVCRGGYTIKAIG